MNFFEHQDRAHQNTQRLIGLFILSVFCIIISIYGAALVSFGLIFRGTTSSALWQPQVFLLVTIPTVVVIGSGSCYKLLTLNQGGCVIAHDLGGRLLLPEIANPSELQLLNVVEEMAIAAGISVPAVYVLDNEDGINAFAAGSTYKNAVIGVTQGALDQLNRDELQGVIGHEFSHILNGDMRLNLRLVGLLHGILLLYLTGRILFNWNHGFRRNDKENGLVWFGLALMIIGSVGMLCGRLIKNGVSRQREFLADASAVQFTRNPSGIAEALRKISKYRYSSLVHSPYAEANSHLFFGSALSNDFLGELFVTHPPFNQRIRRLEASSRSQIPISNSGTQTRGEDIRVMGLARHTPQRISNEIKVNPNQGWLAQLPESIRLGLQEQQSATAIVYALALDAETLQREQQIHWLRQAEPSAVVEKTIQFSQVIQKLNPRLRLPLLDLTVPALQTATQCQQLFKNLNGLAKVDGLWSLPEFVLYIILWQRLQPHLKPTTENQVQHTTLESVWSDCLILVSALAQVGQNKPEAITYVFRAGLYRLPGVEQQQFPKAPPAWNFNALKRSLGNLSMASPKLKQVIVDACAYMVLMNNKVTVQEADLLRAIVITLDCPLPPFLKPNS